MTVELPYTIRIGLYVYGTKLDINQLTSKSGVKPTKSHKLGDSYSTSTGSKVAKKTGMWALLSSDNVTTLPEAFDELSVPFSRIALSRVLESTDLGIDEAFIDVFVCASGQKLPDSAEFEFSHKQLILLNELGVSVKFTVCTIAT